ncbi:MAG: hypothetical protein ACYDHH_00250 [Solirubrobacteraceae bacterium]
MHEQLRGGGGQGACKLGAGMYSWGKLAMACGVVLAMLAVSPAMSSAATETMSLSVAPNPAVDGGQATISATGSSDQLADVWVADHSPGSSGCAPNPSQDPSAQIIGQYVSGSYSVQGGGPPTGVGQHLLCGWLMPYAQTSGTPLYSTSIPLNVTPQSATLTLSIGPPGQTVTAHYSVNADMQLFVAVIRASGGPCASSHASASADATDISGQLGFDYDNVSPMYSPGTMTYQVGYFSPGTWRVCGWLQRSVTGGPYDSGAVVAGPATTTFTVSGSTGSGPSGPSEVLHGRTSQHLPIRITTQGNQITTIDWTAHFRCNRTVFLSRGTPGTRWNGNYSESILFGPGSSAGVSLVIKGNGRFGAALNGKRRHTLTIKGTRIGRRLKGIFGETLSPAPRFGFTAPAGTVCRTGAVHFDIK